MKKIIPLFVLITLSCYSQTSVVKKIPSSIVVHDDYENLMKYKTKIYKTKNSTILYLDGLRNDADLIYLDDYLNLNLKFS